MDRIQSILDEINSLLIFCGHTAEASWLEQRAIQLNSVSSEDQEEVILAQIKKVIAGMGSLSDIYLLPPKNAKISKDEANLRLTRLITDLENQINAKLFK